MNLLKRYFGYNRNFQLKDKEHGLIAIVNIQVEPHVISTGDRSFEVKIVNMTNKRLKRFNEYEGLIAVIEPNSDFSYTVDGLGITRKGLDDFGMNVANIDDWKIE